MNSSLQWLYKNHGWFLTSEQHLTVTKAKTKRDTIRNTTNCDEEGTYREQRTEDLAMSAEWGEDRNLVRLMEARREKGKSREKEEELRGSMFCI